jgi:hypothetical protein
MKHVLLHVYAVLFSLGTLVSSAAAQDAFSTFGQLQGFSFTGNGSTVGIGVANFAGVTGSAFTVQDGNSTSDLILTAEGNHLCDLTCATGHLSYVGRSTQQVISSAFAHSDLSGTPAIATGETHSAAFQSLMNQSWYQGLVAD